MPVLHWTGRSGRHHFSDCVTVVLVWGQLVRGIPRSTTWPRERYAQATMDECKGMELDSGSGPIDGMAEAL